MAQYPDVNTETSTYRVGIDYGMALPSEHDMTVWLPGGHDNYRTAHNRALAVTRALREAGEMGIRPWVGFTGERPSGFPKSGVRVPERSEEHTSELQSLMRISYAVFCLKKKKHTKKKIQHHQISPR